MARERRYLGIELANTGGLWTAHNFSCVQVCVTQCSTINERGASAALSAVSALDGTSGSSSVADETRPRNLMATISYAD
jgi:hypothetical protein